MRNSRLLAWFIGSALLAALACSPSVTQAATRTLGYSAFKQSVKLLDAQGNVVYVGLRAAIPAGTDFSSGEVTGAYFDYRERAGKLIRLELGKTTYTGSYYSDYVNRSGAAEYVYRDVYLAAVNVKAVPSSYDYLSAFFGSNSASLEDEIEGVALMK